MISNIEVHSLKQFVCFYSFGLQFNITLLVSIKKL